MPPARRSTRTTSSASNQPYPQANNRTSPRPSASVSKPAQGSTSLRLTVKAPPSKLRQATSGSAIPPNPYADQSESDDTPAPPVRTARATRNPKVVVDPDSDEDEDEDAEGEEMDEDEDAGNEDSEADAEGEEDEEMDDHPPPPVIKQQRAPGQAKPQVTVLPPNEGPLKSVEDKELDDEDEDEELSELDSGDELGNDIGEGEEDDGELDSDEEDDSRSVTPDLTKLTKRQRGAFEDDPALMALSNEALKKKHLTAEEHVQRRAEMARRRKNLSEKRNEEEKVCSFPLIFVYRYVLTVVNRWKRSTSFFKNKLQRGELEQRSTLPTLLLRKTKVKIPKVDRKSIRCMCDGCRTKMAADWECLGSGSMGRLARSSAGKEAAG